MYIRRKVFSVLADEMGEERLYSVNETVFNGFEYEEVDDRYFADHDAEIAGAAKGAGAVGAGAGLVGAGVYGSDKALSKYLATKRAKRAAINKEHGKAVGEYVRAVKDGRLSKESLDILNQEQLATGKRKLSAKAGKLEKAAKSTRSALKSAEKLIKNNPKTAAAILAGVGVAGAATGAAISHNKKD